MSEVHAALGDVRVVDLSGPPGYYCTKLLAELGADVVRVESPDDGWEDPGPFLSGGPEPGQSLYRYHFHTNKRSIGADIRSPEGRGLLASLLEAADVLIETFPRGEAAALGLDPEAVRAAHPRLIHVSISPFGSTGPHRDFLANDLVAQAMGGLMSITGFPEEAPNPVGAEQAYHCASLHAAVGTLLALAQRDIDAEGRHVEVSMQDAISMAILQTANFNFYTKLDTVPTRTGMQPRTVPANAAQRFARGPSILPCKDGWVVFTIPPNPPRVWAAFVDWLAEHDAAGELTDPRYADIEFRAASSERVLELQLAFFRDRTKDELYHDAQQRGLLCMPVQTVDDLIRDQQLAARGFFVEVPHPELGRAFLYPGAPYKLSETPHRITRRAPFVGEHTDAVLNEWLGAETGRA